MSTKYLSVIGTRPQYMKLLDNLENHIVVDTQQHYDREMSDVFVRQLKIKPKYNLGETELGRMFDKCIEIIKKENPNIVIVYGDTRSTLAGALAAKFLNKPLAHVESGMRSGDMSQPEELVRVIVDRIADYRFCANEFARQNLIKEAITNNVFVVGDPMWDSLTKVLPLAKTKDSGSYNLLTIHRAQNTDNEKALRDIFQALAESGETFVFPIHPRTRKSLRKFKIKVPKNIELIAPLGYKDMIILETNARKILTDSGGVSREAYWFCKPLIILRTETEWTEIVQDGWGVLVGSSKSQILKALKEHNPHPLRNKQHFVPPFGAKDTIKNLLV